MINKTVKGDHNGSRPVVTTCGVNLSFASQYDLISGKFSSNSEPYKAMVRNVNESLLQAKKEIDTYAVESKAALKMEYEASQQIVEETAPTLDEMMERENLNIADGIPYYVEKAVNPRFYSESFESVYRRSQEYRDVSKSYDELFSVAYHCDDVVDESVVTELDNNDFGKDYRRFCEDEMLREAHEIQDKFKFSKSSQPRITGQHPTEDGLYENSCIEDDDWSFDGK